MKLNSSCFSPSLQLRSPKSIMLPKLLYFSMSCFKRSNTLSSPSLKCFELVDGMYAQHRKISLSSLKKLIFNLTCVKYLFADVCFSTPQQYFPYRTITFHQNFYLLFFTFSFFTPKLFKIRQFETCLVFKPGFLSTKCMTTI